MSGGVHIARIDCVLEAKKQGNTDFNEVSSSASKIVEPKCFSVIFHGDCPLYFEVLFKLRQVGWPVYESEYVSALVIHYYDFESI